MKEIVLAALALLALVSGAANYYPRGCIYIDGKCDHECPVGTHSYTPGCGYLTPEPTCDEPYPVRGKNMICDYSACYCDAPTVRDTTTNNCVYLDQCP